MNPERFEQVYELYHAALEREAGERGELLAQADPELRREVESLLEQSGGLPDRPAWEGAANLLADSTSTQLLFGTQLGPYRIEAPLGAGGMGQVYRAQDTRLGRMVAIKISLHQFSGRFEREARAISALNHPHICTLYDIGPNYLVMEFVEGPTLAERIKQGAIPLDEALGIAKQITDALEAAHEKGITHRDLKPGNIHIKPDGTVKVLDFGLAKIGGAPAAQSEDSPTVTKSPTQAGTILGTAAYMAPEQARGQEVDSRADIWAFGVVLYEMLTGRKLFKGQDFSEIIASVIKEQPNLEPVPPMVRRLLRCCLEKDPKQRLQAIGDWRLLLDDAPSEPNRQRGGRWLWPVASAMLAIVASIALWAPWRVEQPPDRPLVRLDVDLGTDVWLPPPSPTDTSSVAISPDGTRLAYVSGTPRKLFTRRLDQSKTTELPGTEGAFGPFFSPNGQWVGFCVSSTLKKIAVEGGVVIPLANIPQFTGASWGVDGNILVTDSSKGMVRVPAAGGPPEMMAEMIKGDLAMAFPQILPGGKAVLFVAYTQTGTNVDTTIEVMTLANRHRKIVSRGGTSPRYLATSNGAGHLAYTKKAALFAIPFDLDKLEVRGTAVPILDDVANGAPGGISHLAFSHAGTLVYRKDEIASKMTTVQWVDPAGRKEPLLAKPAYYHDSSISPDGKRVALTLGEGYSIDVWVYDQRREAMTRLTFGGVYYAYLTWSPDGQYVVFGSMGENGIFQARADGASQPQTLTQSKTFQIPRSFTPDGKRLAYSEGDPLGQIFTVPLEDKGGRLKAGTPEQFLKSSFDDFYPSFSPDGRWLAYVSNESGTYEVYVRAFPPPPSGQGGKWQISNSGGGSPRWSRTRHELVYRSGNQIMAASYTAKGDTFVAEKPRKWIEKLSGYFLDLAPDGKRVAMLTPVESVEASKQEHEVVLLENFFDELRRKVPVGK